jgi:hypothetical protein
VTSRRDRGRAWIAVRFASGRLERDCSSIVDKSATKNRP